ncbi:hypothetical protein CY0110_16682 [Crocosphaera chwakensis CCY0110]|uniref:Uncharacterized protein n=1 Tax=Crocosphaera chwakensis CCY0110 TaxID=391612 RepID=A3II18_9CHRO|nr:hypothetical protein CY0110_16682 [Crocosphaera chwakensis CCY0110]
MSGKHFDFFSDNFFNNAILGS